MLDKSFQEITNNIENMVSSTQLEIMMDANNKLVNLYYNIGKAISNNYEWGNKFVENLALELKLSFLNSKGFSVRNLNYMKSFYEEYKEDDDFFAPRCKITMEA